MEKEYIIPKIMWLPLLFSISVNSAVYYGARALTAERVHYDFTGFPDEQIPFLPWTIVIYLGCYLFWVVNYIIGGRQDEEKAFQFISADLLAKLICLLCFLICPTTNIRPAVTGNSVWDRLMRLLYCIDAADNLFPSIHCLTSWFCYIAVRKNEKAPKWYRIFSFLTVISICISTLTTKQHVIPDVIAGVGLAEISYFLTKKSGFSRRYGEIIRKMAGRILKRRNRCEQKN